MVAERIGNLKDIEFRIGDLQRKDGLRIERGSIKENYHSLCFLPRRILEE